MHSILLLQLLEHLLCGSGQLLLLLLLMLLEDSVLLLRCRKLK
jgi:hypothetical protein